jgi:hypothetical protein
VTVTVITTSAPPRVGEVKVGIVVGESATLSVISYVPAVEGAVHNVAIGVPVAIAAAAVIVNSVDVVPVVAVFTPPGVTVELEKVPPVAEIAAVVETFA